MPQYKAYMIPSGPTNRRPEGSNGHIGVCVDPTAPELVLLSEEVVRDAVLAQVVQTTVGVTTQSKQRLPDKVL